MKTHIAIAVALSALLVMPSVAATAATQVDDTVPGLEAPNDYRAADTAASFDAASTLLPAAGVYESERALILQQTNTLRAQNGLPPLRLNAALNDIAQDWSVQQALVSAMSHRPNFHLLYPAGWSRASENVAAGYSPTSVVGAWAGSPGHRANMLSSSTDIGIGVAVSSTGRLYYTQNFGRYASAPPTPPGNVHRIAGSDRFAASANISQRTFPAGAPIAYVASGLNFPDALSAAALAGAAGGPLLLVAPGSVPSLILQELRRLDPERIVVAGGPASVSESVMATLRTVSPNVDRMSGSDRYEASRALALDAYGASGARTVFIATGNGFADALAAGPAAASLRAPVLLVPGLAATADGATLALLQRLGTQKVVIVGGPGSVTAGIATSLANAGHVVERVGGADRFEVSAKLAAIYFPNATRAYVATGLGFADALSGGAAAGAIGAPMFTVLTGCVPASTHTELASQGPDDMILLGGFGTLTPSVAGFYRC